jgi:hypothetical protein
MIQMRLASSSRSPEKLLPVDRPMSRCSSVALHLKWRIA